jgi:hypothetical protein
MMWAMGADGDLDMPVEQQLLEPLDASGSKLDLDFGMLFLESRGQRGEQERRRDKGATDLQPTGLGLFPQREDRFNLPTCSRIGSIRLRKSRPASVSSIPFAVQPVSLTPSPAQQPQLLGNRRAG